MGLRTAPLPFQQSSAALMSKKLEKLMYVIRHWSKRKKKGRNELRFYIMKMGFVEQVYNKILVN